MRQSSPEILPPGRKNPSPEKEIPGSEIIFSSPEIFFSSPVSSDGGLESLFPAIWNFFTDKSPMSICRHKPRPAYVPGNPGAGTARTRDKKKACALYLRHLDFRTFRETAFFAPATVPCSVQANLRGFQMTKCQISRQIAKCQIRRSVSAGKHEIVPRHISTAPEFL